MRKLMNIIVSIIGMVSLGLAGADYYAFRIMPQNALDSTKKNAPVDAITVPSYPFHKDSWNGLTRDRVHWSYYLYRKNYTCHLIYLGSAVYKPYGEGETMAMYAENPAFQRIVY